MLKLLMFLGVISALLFSCSKDVISETQYLFKKNVGDGIAARIGKIVITDQELVDGIEAEIYEAENKIFDIKMDKLKAMILEKLMLAHPKKSGLSNDEFMEKYIASTINVSEKDIEGFIKKKNIPKEHVNPQIKERIKDFLTHEKKRGSVDRWVAGQLDKKPVEVFVEKPKRPTFDVKSGDSASWGDKNSKVQIVEFSDFQCPFCAKGADVLKQLKAKYGKKIHISFKQFPLPFHKNARGAANAALCASEQSSDLFWKLHDHMFANQDSLDVQMIKDAAAKMGINKEQFATCMDTNKHAAKIDSEMEEGKKVGVKSTPTFFVNGQLLQGAQPIEVFSEIIDSNL